MSPADSPTPLSELLPELDIYTSRSIRGGYDRNLKLWETLREEAPQISESTAFALVADMLPGYDLQLTSAAPVAVDLICKQWASRDLEISVPGLAILNEFATRAYALHTGDGKSRRRTSIKPFASPDELVSIAKRFLTANLSFFLNRFRQHPPENLPKRRLWFEFLCYISGNHEEALNFIFDEIRGCANHQLFIPLVYLANSQFRDKVFWRHFLDELMLSSNSDKRFLGLCFLAAQGVPTPSIPEPDLTPSLDALLDTTEVWDSIKLVSGDLFYLIVARVLGHDVDLGSACMYLVAETLKKIFGDERTLSLSASTASGKLELFAYVESAGALMQPTQLSPPQHKVVQAIYENTFVWNCETELWSLFGLEEGRSSLRLLMNLPVKQSTLNT